MKNTMIMAVACLSAAIGSAQMMDTAVKVNLPHDTQVGKVVLPAGKYSIKEISSSVIEIKSDSPKGENIFALVSPVTADHNADHTKVVLNQDDSGNYELKSIWLEGSEVGFELE
jgi:hypothetical protein